MRLTVGEILLYKRKIQTFQENFFNCKHQAQRGSGKKRIRCLIVSWFASTSMDCEGINQLLCTHFFKYFKSTTMKKNILTTLKKDFKIIHSSYGLTLCHSLCQMGPCWVLQGVWNVDRKAALLPYSCLFGEILLPSKPVVVLLPKKNVPMSLTEGVRQNVFTS